MLYEVITGDTLSGTCDTSIYLSGTASFTCNNGTWGSYTENCVEYADCPAEGEEGYPDPATYLVASWTGTA